MAIQIPNPGTGNGATGDNEFVLWSKVKDNFTDQTNAASRLVGEATGNLLEVGTHGVASVSKAITDKTLVSDLRNGFYVKSTVGIISYGQQYPQGFKGILELPTGHNNLAHTQITVFQGDWTGKSIDDPTRVSSKHVVKLYTDRNTTKDSNGFIKASSPVLRVFSDRIEGNDDGKKMGATFIKNSVGNYLLKGTTGLADEGWYVTVPQDANGNNLVAVEYESLENGDVVLRTYKRKFDFETVSIVADHDNPLDIPDTRWVDLRFNDLPLDDLDDTQTEV